MVSPTFCVPSVTSGCSFGGSCSLRHDIFLCSCGSIFLERDREPHTQGKRHRAELASRQRQTQVPRPYTNRGGAPRSGARGGFRGGRGGARGRGGMYTGQGGPNGRGVPAPSEEDPLLNCDKCRKKVLSSEYDAHTQEHNRQDRMRELRDALEWAKEDKNGVTVSARPGIHFGILDINLKAVEVVITVASTESPVRLHSCKMESSNRGDEHGNKFSARPRGSSKVIQKGASRQISILFHPSYDGHYEDTLQLAFFDIERHNNFVISRTVEATVGSREDHDQLKAKAPYARRKTTKLDPVGNIIPSLRPPTWTKTLWVDRLPLFEPPAHLTEAAYGNAGKNPLSVVKRFMPAILNEQTYPHHFQTLLWLEEHRVKLDLDAYSLTDVKLEPDHPRYKLMVEGLAENRPSVLVGDFILVSHSEPIETISTRTWYEGRVQRVHENHVSLAFGDNFSTYRGTKFDVRFVLNRLPFRRMHHALVNKFNPSRLLFPGPVHIQGVSRIRRAQIEEIVPFDRPIGQDEEQIETVAAILNQKPGSVPFVVFGPPGTGKTVTIVEAMQQLLQNDPNVRILACAPNNSAADTIAIKLLNLGKSQLFRLNALSRKIPEMPESLRLVSLINGNQVFVMPTKEELLKFRVVVSTCLSGGVPANLGLQRGHFTHIFIDEAGQGKEPEVMVPIKSIANDKTNVIIAGDNQQLGPVINSHIASSLGLKISYLTRIMDRPIYDLDTGRGITIVKLVKNFRNHPDILQFSNENFYKSELQPCGNRVLTHSLENYEDLPKKKFPLIFHSIVGKDEREASSPSFFNIPEVTLVKKYCLSLLDNRKNGLKAEHIGVITPYHAQRCKILDLFHKDFKLRGIKVGSVEEFQGQERRVIIMSTVRSNSDYITSDIKRSLGFVANKSRLNVALTRAQALLIVIGNPVVLSLDPLWRGFLNYVYTRGGWKGKAIDWDPTEPILANGEYGSARKTQAEGEMEETIERLRALIIQKHEDDGFELDEEEDEDAAAFERPILREAE